MINNDSNDKTVGDVKVGNLSVFKEILETEKSYRNDIDILLESISKTDNIPNNALFSQIKPTITCLIKCSNNLEKNLLETVQTENQKDKNTLRVKRMQLLDFYYGIYQQYVGLYKTYQSQQATSTNKLKDLNKTIQEISTQRGNKKYLSDCMMSPIQRGMRYRLLVNELLKMQDSFDKETSTHLNKLNEKIETTLNSVNSNSEQGYQFGDITRSALHWLWSKGNDNQDNNQSHSPKF